MLLVDSSSAALLAGGAALLLWAFWMATFKASGWRFELYSLDFLAGALVAALAAFLTLGALGDGITALDNLAIASGNIVAVALAAGCVLALGVMCQLAVASAGGMAVAVLITLSAGFAVHHLLRLAAEPKGNHAGAIAVALLSLAAVGLAIAAFHASQREARGPGIVLGLLGGICFGTMFRLLDVARSDDIDLQPYPLVLLAAMGALPSGILYDLFFSNLPIRSKPISLLSYFRGTLVQHAAGIAGGAIWSLGLLCLILAVHAQPEAGLSAVGGAAIAYGSAVPAALGGVLAGKELADGRGLNLLRLSMLGLAAAVGLSLLPV
ncbi:MAG: hypothetical protein R2729_11905 [Bryobacteraceae bacterium]